MKTEIAEARRLVSEGGWEEAMALSGQERGREKRCKNRGDFTAL